MRGSLIVILLQLPLCLMVQLDVLDDVHSMYHGIEATETELQLAAILGLCRCHVKLMYKTTTVHSLTTVFQATIMMQRNELFQTLLVN